MGLAQKRLIAVGAQFGLATLDSIVGCDMLLIKIAQKPIHLERIGRLLVGAPGCKTQDIPLPVKGFKSFLYLFWHEKRLFEMNTARFTPLRWGMTISLTIELIPKIPLLKNTAAQCPQGAVTRKDVLYRKPQHFTCIHVQTVDQLKTNIPLEKGRIEEMGTQPGGLYGPGILFP